MQNESRIIEDLKRQVHILKRTVDNQDELISALRGQIPLRPLDHLERVHHEVLDEVERIREMPPAQTAIYSSVFFLPEDVLSHSTVRLFTHSLGQADSRGRLITRSESNLKEGGYLPGRCAACIKSVVVELLDGSDEDARQVRETGVIAFDAIQTDLDVSPLGVFSWDSSGRKGIFRLADRDASPEPTKSPDLVVLSQSGLLWPGTFPISMVLMFGRTDRLIEKELKVRVSLLFDFVQAIEVG